MNAANDTEHGAPLSDWDVDEAEKWAQNVRENVEDLIGGTGKEEAIPKTWLI